MTPTQIAAIIMLLQAFGLDAQTVAKVSAVLTPVELGAKTEVKAAPLPDPPRVVPEVPAVLPPQAVVPALPPPQPAPVVPAPAVPEVPSDTTPPNISQLDIYYDHEYRMSISADEPITYSVEGATIGTVYYDNVYDENSRSSIVLPNGVTKYFHPYFYRAALDLTRPDDNSPYFVTVTITDLAGNSVTKRVRVR